MAVTEARPAIAPAAEGVPVVRRTPRRLAERDWIVFAGLLAAVAVYYLAPGLVPSFAGYLVFLALAAWRPDLALVVIVCVLPFYYHPRPWGGLRFAPSEMLLIATALAWAIRDARPVTCWLAGGEWRRVGRRGLHERATSLLGRTFGGPFLFFGLAAVLSLVLPDLVEPKVALREFRTAIAEPMIFYLLVLRFVRTRRQIEWLVGGLVLTAAIVGRYGIEQYLLNRGAWEMDGVRRVSSFYPSATALGLFLGRILPIAGALAILLPNGGRRLGYAILCLPIAAGLILSWTRAAWLGVFAAFALLVVLTGGRRLVAGFVGASAVAIAGLLVTRPERITALFSTGEGTHTSRLVIWQSAANVLRDHPITGVGLDQYLHLDAARYGIPHIRFMLYSHPHNLLLDFWIRLGLLGLIALVWLLVRFYRQALALRRDLRDPFCVALALGLIGSMTHFVVHGLFDLAYFQSDLAFLFWLTLALIEVLRRIASDTPDLTPEAEAALAGNSAGRR